MREGLLPMAMCQSRKCRLMYRHREQAPSHIAPRVPLAATLLDVVNERRDDLNAAAFYHVGRRLGQWLGVTDHIRGGAVQVGVAGAAHQLVGQHIALCIDHEAQAIHAFLATVQSALRVLLYFCRCASRAPSQEALAAPCCGDGPGAGWADFSAGVLVGGVSLGGSSEGFSLGGSGFFSTGLGGCGLGLGLTGLGTWIVGLGASASFGSGSSSTGAGGCGGVTTLGGAGGGGAGIGARSMTMAAGGSWTVRGADQWSAMAIAMACTPSTTARLVP